VEAELHKLTSALEGGDTINIKKSSNKFPWETFFCGGKMIIIMAVKSVSKTSIYTAQLKWRTSDFFTPLSST
jgi:hypothetical protein